MNPNDTKAVREMRGRREEWRRQELLNIEASKAKMSAKYSLKRNAKFEIAWEIAWDYGHSSGFGEVERFFGKLAELMRP